MGKTKIPAKSSQIQRAPAKTSQIAPPRPAPLMRQLQPAPEIQRVGCACGGEVGADGECPACRKRRETIQRKMTVNTPGDAYEQEADQVARQVMRSVDVTPTQPSATPTLFRSRAEDLVDSFTSWHNLDEGALGRALITYAHNLEFAFIQQVLNELDDTDRDDVSFEFMRSILDDDLDEIAGYPDGRALLDRMYDELTEGSAADDEIKQANRIMQAKIRRITPQEAEQSLLKPKIFPYRQMGITVMNDAIINAERRSGGRIWVDMPNRTAGVDEFRAEINTLPSAVFGGGIELPENEIVGVKLYDEGGKLVYQPALYLVQLSNKADTATLWKIAEVAGYGLSFGVGGLAVKGGMLARAALWADRIATAVGVMSSLINEHRGWIISTFGESGEKFLTWVDRVNTVVMWYGGARALVGMGQLVNALRTSYQDWRKVRQLVELGEDETRVVQQLSNHVDDLLHGVDEGMAVEKAVPVSGSYAPHEPPLMTPPSPEAPAGAAPKPSAPRGKAFVAVDKPLMGEIKKGRPVGTWVEPSSPASVTRVRGGISASQQKLDELSRFREALARQDKSVKPSGRGGTTLASLEIDDQIVFGRSSKKASTAIDTNIITSTHAEGDVFNQALQKGLRGKKAVLTIDHPAGLCASCDRIDGIRKMAQQLGIEDLTLITPDFSYPITIPKGNP